MSIMAYQKIDSYYVEDRDFDDDDDETWKEYCDEAPDNWDTTLQICEERRQDVYFVIWGSILSLGLTLMCFAQAGNIQSQKGKNK